MPRPLSAVALPLCLLFASPRAARAERPPMQQDFDRCTPWTGDR